MQIQDNHGVPLSKCLYRGSGFRLRKAIQACCYAVPGTDMPPQLRLVRQGRGNWFLKMADDPSAPLFEIRVPARCVQEVRRGA